MRKSGDKSRPRLALQGGLDQYGTIRVVSPGQTLSRKQLDFFRAETEPELPDEDWTPPVTRANPEKVRAELHAILGQARAASILPWDRRTAGYYRVVFPQMANWLPEEEAKQLCFAFEEEMKRLKAA